MTIGIVLAVLFGSTQLGLGNQAAKQGREGNSHLKAEAFEEASTSFQNGLTEYTSNRQVDDTYYGLQHNLGVSLFRQEDFEQAQAAFDAARAHAPSDLERARAAYNAGNNAFQSQAAEAALAHYRDALLANPEDEDAKFNYEFVKRFMEQQQEQENQQQNNDEEQDEQEQDQDQENQQGQQEENEPQPNEEQQEQEQPQQEPGEDTESGGQPEQSNDKQLTREQAEQILEALENEEQELLRQVQKVEGRRRRVAKDW